MSRPALFLDRDGVVNVERNYLFRIEECAFMDGVFEICRRFRERGYATVVVTNQAGIARGYYTVEEMHRLHAWMAERFSERGVPFDGFYHCPHHPDRTGPCSCRKPEPGMILQAAADLDLDLARSAILGDKDSDLEAGRRAGVRWLGKVSGMHGIESIAMDGKVFEPSAFADAVLGGSGS